MIKSESEEKSSRRANRYRPLDQVKYQMLFKYALNKGPRAKVFIENLIEQDRIDENDEHELRYFIQRLIERVNPKELKFYNAYDSSRGSLTDRIQVSILEPSQANDVYVFKNTAAVDFHFRNLKFQNVLVNMSQGQSKFVFPVEIFSFSQL